MPVILVLQEAGTGRLPKGSGQPELQRKPCLKINRQNKINTNKTNTR